MGRVETRGADVGADVWVKWGRRGWSSGIAMPRGHSACGTADTPVGAVLHYMG